MRTFTETTIPRVADSPAEPPDPDLDRLRLDITVATSALLSALHGRHAKARAALDLIEAEIASYERVALPALAALGTLPPDRPSWPSAPLPNGHTVQAPVPSAVQAVIDSQKPPADLRDTPISTVLAELADWSGSVRERLQNDFYFAGIETLGQIVGWLEAEDRELMDLVSLEKDHTHLTDLLRRWFGDHGIPVSGLTPLGCLPKAWHAEPGTPGAGPGGWQAAGDGPVGYPGPQSVELKAKPKSKKTTKGWSKPDLTPLTWTAETESAMRDIWSASELLRIAKRVLGRPSPDMNELALLVLCGECWHVRLASEARCPGGWAGAGRLHPAVKCTGDKTVGYHDAMRQLHVIESRKSAPSVPAADLGAEKPKRGRKPKVDKPYGFSMTVSLNDGTERDAHYVCKTAEQAGRLAHRGIKGLRSIRDVEPLNREAYQRTYGSNIKN